MRAVFFQILRGLFALLLLTTAIGKLLDNRGFANVIATYEMGLPTGNGLLFLALGFSLFELFLGMRVAADRGRRWNGKLLIALHLGYSLLAAVTLYRGIALENCGCFGIFWARPLTSMTIVEDGILTILSVFYWKLSRAPKKITRNSVKR